MLVNLCPVWGSTTEFVVIMITWGDNYSGLMFPWENIEIEENRHHPCQNDKNIHYISLFSD